MSYDLIFWKQNQPLEREAEEVFEALLDDERVEGVADLPGDAIAARFKMMFPGFDYESGEASVETEDGSFDVYIGEQYVNVMVYGPTGDPQNKILKIMRAFECPLYDPQDGVRHDAADGTDVGELPDFTELTPEQKAEVERIKTAYLASFDRKWGCRTKVLVLAGIVVSVVVFVVSRVV